MYGSPLTVVVQFWPALKVTILTFRPVWLFLIATSSWVGRLLSWPASPRHCLLIVIETVLPLSADGIVSFAACAPEDVSGMNMHMAAVSMTRVRRQKKFPGFILISPLTPRYLHSSYTLFLAGSSQNYIQQLLIFE